MARAEHAEGCESGQCAADCAWRRFHEWLAEPLLPHEVAEEARRSRRYAELMSGEIPA